MRRYRNIRVATSYHWFIGLDRIMYTRLICDKVRTGRPPYRQSTSSYMWRCESTTYVCMRVAPSNTMPIVSLRFETSMSNGNFTYAPVQSVNTMYLQMVQLALSLHIESDTHPPDSHTKQTQNKHKCGLSSTTQSVHSTYKKTVLQQSEWQ